MKTLGQIAYETGQEATVREFRGFAVAGDFPPVAWDDLEPELKRCHEATANAVRAAVIDECARELKKWRWQLSRDQCLKPGVLIAEEAADFIGSLKAEKAR